MFSRHYYLELIAFSGAVEYIWLIRMKSSTTRIPSHRIHGSVRFDSILFHSSVAYFRHLSCCSSWLQLSLSFESSCSIWFIKLEQMIFSCTPLKCEIWFTSHNYPWSASFGSCSDRRLIFISSAGLQQSAGKESSALTVTHQKVRWCLHEFPFLSCILPSIYLRWALYRSSFPFLFSFCIAFPMRWYNVIIFWLDL